MPLQVCVWLSNLISIASVFVFYFWEVIIDKEEQHIMSEDLYLPTAYSHLL